jgi:hypothetical protein
VEFNEIKPPYDDLIYEETKSIVYNFCTLCSLLKNKKLNFQHIFAILLTEENYRELFKQLINEESDLEAYRTILTIEPSIASSKYISKLGRMTRKDDDRGTEEDL